MTKIRAVLRRRWSILLSGLVVGVLAGALSTLMAPDNNKAATFEATQLIVANGRSQQSGNVEQDALRVTRGTVSENAARALGETSPGAVASKVSAVADPDSSSIEVSSSDKNPDDAAARVDAYVNAFLQVVNADLLADQQKRLTELQQQLDRATTELGEFNSANPLLGRVPALDPSAEQSLLAQRSGLEQTVESAETQLRNERLNAQATLPYSALGAEVPTKVDSDLLPVPTGLPFRMGLLGLFGLALAVGLVMIVERTIPRIDTRDELVTAVELPVLAEVGYFPHRKLPREKDGTLRLDGAWAEPYRRIRSAIQFVQSDGSLRKSKVFLFTSPSPSEGKSTTTAVTGLAMAEAGEQTLVVGGDFRRPSVHGLLGVSATPGIREHARLDIDRPTTQQIVHPTDHEHLYVAPSGAPGKEVVGLADAARELVTEAVDQGATVFIDTSPVEVANDAIDLLPVVDEVIVIVRSGRTATKTLLHTVEQLQMHGASIMGVALIGTPGLAKQQYYYEGYYATDPGVTLAPPDDAKPDAPKPPPTNGTHPAPESSGQSDPTRTSQPIEASVSRAMTPPPFSGKPAEGH